jgi:hypothetical protein
MIEICLPQEKLVFILQRACGAVEAGKEPWRGSRHRQVTGNTAMVYVQNEVTGKPGMSLAIVHIDGRWSFTEWDHIPPQMLEDSLKGKIPFEELLKVPGMEWSGIYDFTEESSASSAFCRWCLRYCWKSGEWKTICEAPY